MDLVECLMENENYNLNSYAIKQLLSAYKEFKQFKNEDIEDLDKFNDPLQSKRLTFKNEKNELKNSIEKTNRISKKLLKKIIKILEDEIASL